MISERSQKILDMQKQTEGKIYSLKKTGEGRTVQYSIVQYSTVLYSTVKKMRSLVSCIEFVMCNVCNLRKC